MVLDFFLGIVDLTSVRGFAFNFDLTLIFEKTCLVFILVSVVSSAFNKLPFVFTVGIIRNISGPNRSYSKISKTVPIYIILTTVPEI